MYVLLARDAPVGVIVRRDASKCSQLLLWNTETDVIEPGQWLGAELDLSSMDLSPNGRWLIYYARPKVPWQKSYDRTEDGWTAISRPPYFTALAIWLPVRDGPWGGLFTSNEEVWLSWRREQGDVYERPEVRAKGCPLLFRPGGAAQLSRSELDGWRTVRDLSEQPVELPALANSVWQAMTDEEFVKRKDQEAAAQRRGLRVRTRTRSKTNGDLHLWRVEDELGRPLKFQLRDESGTILRTLKRATWADWDPSGRLVFGASGCLWQGSWDASAGWSQGKIAEVLRGEFSNVTTPAWALEW